MSNVQFDDEVAFDSRRFNPGSRGETVPHVSADTKLMSGIFIAIMIAATLYVYLKYVNSQHAFVDDSEVTPHSGITQ